MVNPKQAEATIAEALSYSILLLEWQAEDSAKAGNISHRNEYLSYIKALRQLKSEDTTMVFDRNKGTVTGTQAEFDELVNAIVAKIKPQINEAIKSLKIDTSLAKRKPPAKNPFFDGGQQASFSDALFSKNGRSK